MKADEKVDESPQTELEIHSIVEKARRRRNTEQTREKPSTDIPRPQQNGGNGVAHDQFELGIAEVPQQKPARRMSRSA